MKCILIGLKGEFRAKILLMVNSQHPQRRGRKFTEKQLKASLLRSLALAWAGQIFIQCPTRPSAALLDRAHWSAAWSKLSSSALLSSARSIWASGGLLCATSRWGFHPLYMSSVAVVKPVECLIGCQMGRLMGRQTRRQMDFRPPFLLHTRPHQTDPNLLVVGLVIRTHPQNELRLVRCLRFWIVVSGRATDVHTAVDNGLNLWCLSTFGYNHLSLSTSRWHAIGNFRHLKTFLLTIKGQT